MFNSALYFIYISLERLNYGSNKISDIHKNV